MLRVFAVCAARMVVSMISIVHSIRPGILFKHLQNCLLARTVDFQLFISNVCYELCHNDSCIQIKIGLLLHRRMRKESERQRRKQIQYGPAIFLQEKKNNKLFEREWMRKLHHHRKLFVTQQKYLCESFHGYSQFKMLISLCLIKRFCGKWNLFGI